MRKISLPLLLVFALAGCGHKGSDNGANAVVARDPTLDYTQSNESTKDEMSMATKPANAVPPAQ